MHASTHGKRCVLRTLKAEKVLNLRHRNYFSAVEYKDAVECVVEKFHCNIVTHTNTHNFRRNAKSTLPHIAWLTDFTASLRIVFLFISVPLKSFIQVNRMKNLSHSSYSKRRKLMRTKKNKKKKQQPKDARFWFKREWKNRASAPSLFPKVFKYWSFRGGINRSYLRLKFMSMQINQLLFLHSAMNYDKMEWRGWTFLKCGNDVCR